MIVKRNENTAELVGLSFGDGGLTIRKNTNKKRFQMAGDLREDKEHYDVHIIPLFNREIMMPIFKRNVGVIFNKKKNFYGISVESPKISDELNYLGIPTGVKNELFIPSWIKENDSYAKKFLRGFFDTDGSIFCQRNYSIKNNKKHTQIKLALACTSNNVMQEIYDLLKKMGFKCMIRKTFNKDGIRKPDNKVSISGGIQVNKWFELIGSKNPKHVTKYNIWKEFGFCPPRTTLQQRKQILKREVSPYFYYAGVPERSNGPD